MIPALKNKRTNKNRNEEEGRTKSKIRKGTGEETKTRDRRRRKATWAARRAGGGRGGQVPGGSVNPASCARAGPGRRCPGRCEPGASGDVRGKQGSQSPKPEAAEAPNRVYVYTRFQAPRLLRRLHFSSSSLKGNQFT
uniref:Uncharacterized protein n=1 Tax=Rousettus aegyptiacus TaxID=9407 RepID=A0A7J8KBK3_ROUAE|nr:hypothetical protein HJG63_008042 [Rousettus aegyptiacus]